MAGRSPLDTGERPRPGAESTRSSPAADEGVGGAPGDCSGAGPAWTRLPAPGYRTCRVLRRAARSPRRRHSLSYPSSDRPPALHHRCRPGRRGPPPAPRNSALPKPRDLDIDRRSRPAPARPALAADLRRLGEERPAPPAPCSPKSSSRRNRGLFRSTADHVGGRSAATQPKGFPAAVVLTVRHGAVGAIKTGFDRPNGVRGYARPAQATRHLRRPGVGWPVSPCPSGGRSVPSPAARAA